MFLIYVFTLTVPCMNILIRYCSCYVVITLTVPWMINKLPIYWTAFPRYLIQIYFFIKPYYRLMSWIRMFICSLLINIIHCRLFFIATTKVNVSKQTRLQGLDKMVRAALEAVWQNVEAAMVVWSDSLQVVMQDCQYCNVWLCLAGLRVSLLQDQRRVPAWVRVWVPHLYHHALTQLAASSP